MFTASDVPGLGSIENIHVPNVMPSTETSDQSVLHFSAKPFFPATLKIKDTFETERKVLERVTKENNLTDGLNFSYEIDRPTDSAIKLIAKQDRTWTT